VISKGFQWDLLNDSESWKSTPSLSVPKWCNRTSENKNTAQCTKRNCSTTGPFPEPTSQCNTQNACAHTHISALREMSLLAFSFHFTVFADDVNLDMDTNYHTNTHTHIHARTHTHTVVSTRHWYVHMNAFAPPLRVLGAVSRAPIYTHTYTHTHTHTQTHHIWSILQVRFF